MTHTEKSLMALHYKACEYDPFAERETAFRLAIREVLAERDELRKDAERYRWLRDSPDSEPVVRLFRREWDAAIDAAMKEQP